MTAGRASRAFLLAGGRGDRLQPLTRAMPKCLVPIGGEPLLGIWFDLLVREGITDVLVNVSHHAGQVRDFISVRRPPLHIELVVEEAPRGNAGTVAAHRAFVASAEHFWVFYSDNLTTVRLDPMRAAHAGHRAPLTMGLFRTPNPAAAGIATLDAAGRVVAFEEKPQHPASNLANAGIYLARRELLDSIPNRTGVVDFGFDVFPRLAGRIHGHVIDDFLMDVGTHAALGAARRAWTAAAAEGQRS
jgi:mannose-1-phosphate guanylyltransferase